MAKPPHDHELDAAVGRLVRSWAWYEEQLVLLVNGLNTAIEQHLLQTDGEAELHARWDARKELFDTSANQSTDALFRTARREARHAYITPEVRCLVDHATTSARCPLGLRQRVAHAPTLRDGKYVFGLSPKERAGTEAKYSALVRRTPPQEKSGRDYRRTAGQIYASTDAIKFTDLSQAADELDVLTVILKRINRHLFDQTFGTPDVLFSGVLDVNGNPLNLAS